MGKHNKASSAKCGDYINRLATLADIGNFDEPAALL
jgi:hypothetical protein